MLNNNVIAIYDNTNKPISTIKSIIGKKRFDEVIFKGQNLKKRMFDEISNISFISKVYEINEIVDLHGLISQFEKLSLKTTIIHIMSNCVISDLEDFNILIQKAKFIKNNILVRNDSSNHMIMFKDISEYLIFLKHALYNKNIQAYSDIIEYYSIESNAMIDISIHSNFVQYISGGFDARYFNSLKGDKYTVIKSSNVKNKIKSEYQFYHLLPEKMKKWFVLPYDYTENEFTASYSMERYNMSDMAIKWIHGSVDVEQFNRLMEKLLYFINDRSKMKISEKKYLEISNQYYLSKLDSRIEQLKSHELFPNIDSFIIAGTEFKSIDHIIDKYKTLYAAIMKQNKFEPISVIGHGDLCFSNMLYDNETMILRFIDPKGALQEGDLWANPYYDIAKLSHSICGLYDFFNSGLYEIDLDSNLKFRLLIDFDNSQYKKVFKQILHENNLNYTCVRIFEVSLFLSMLPLHMDYPKKVYGFLLNAINIMNEVEKDV